MTDPDLAQWRAQWRAWVRDTGARNELQADKKLPAPTPATAPAKAATDDPIPPSVDDWQRRDALPDRGKVLIAFRVSLGRPVIHAVTK